MSSEKTKSPLQMIANEQKSGNEKLLEDAASKAAKPPSPLDLQREAAMRAQQCSQAVDAVLLQHNCRIRVVLQPPEMVGNDGSKALISAIYGILPNPQLQG